MRQIPCAAANLAGPAPKPPPSDSQLAGSVLSHLFSIPHVLVRPDVGPFMLQRWCEHPFLARIGPDVLSGSLDWQTLSARLNEPAFRARRLGSLYLDQGFIAGTGNYLRSEILFLSELHPFRKPRDLSRVQRNRLARETLATARRSYETRGVTNPSKWVRRLEREGLRRAAYRFAVFGREGLPCHACGATIERILDGARRFYLCPTCQN